MVAVRLAEQLARRGHYSFVLTDKPPFAGRQESEFPGIYGNPVQFISPPQEEHSVMGEMDLRGLALSQLIGNVAIEHHLDVIHVHYMLPLGIWASSARTALSSNTALAVTFHGTDVINVPNGVRRIAAQALRHAELVTAVSDSVADQSMIEYGIKRPEVIRNWAPMAEVDEAELQESRNLRQGDELLLVHVSNFRPVKQATHCVEILARVNKKRPARLVLVGDGPDLSEVLEQARCLGLADRVVSLGRRTNPTSVVAACDFLLLPSQSEAVGLVILEAASVGVPTAAYYVGGIPEVVTDGVTGVLAAPNDTKSIAQGILRLASDPQRYKTISSECRNMARSLSPADIVEEYENAYRTAIERRVAHICEPINLDRPFFLGNEPTFD